MLFFLRLQELVNLDARVSEHFVSSPLGTWSHDISNLIATIGKGDRNKSVRNET